jgi:hypothetical protein
MKRIILPVVLLWASMLVSPLGAQTANDAATSRIPTVTRLVKLFLELEGALTTTLHEGNAATVDKMLADDFEMRVASMPGNPTPRAEWIKLSLGKPASAFRIEQMAVHDFGDVCVVSFLQAGTPGNRRDPAGDVFTTDSVIRIGIPIRYIIPPASF